MGSKTWDCLVLWGPKKDSFLQNLSQSMSNSGCRGGDGGTAALETCRDESVAFVLKMVAIAAILTAGVGGVTIPLVGKNRRFLRTDSNIFFAAKAFAAGVILATGFVHMLPDATAALTDPCLPIYPWLKFPFSGFFAMMSALATLLVDFVGTQYYERKQEKQKAGQLARVDSVNSAVQAESGIVDVERNGKVFGEEEGGGIHIVGIHAHAAHHRHNHPHGQDACEGNVREHSHDSHVHSHSHGFGDGDEEGGARHVVVSQVILHLLSELSILYNITIVYACWRCVILV
ncbi:hypothetical protein CsSME_00044267 [Camellia sinensis var. sinensis]